MDPWSALGPLPAGYRELFDRVVSKVESDDRIRALWLSGSVAKGSADAGSDLDLMIAIRDEDLRSYADNWRDWLAGITPTLLARELPFAPGSFYSLTPDCLRLDVVAEPVGKLPETGHRRRLVVIDKDGLDALVPEPEPAPGPDPERIAFLAEEFYRCVAIFPFATVARQDPLMGVIAVMGHQRMLYDFYVETNQPQPPMGVKQWSSRLTAHQRAVLEGLPVPQPTLESTSRALRAIADTFGREARPLLEAAGLVWPEQLANTTSSYVERELARLDRAG